MVFYHSGKKEIKTAFWQGQERGHEILVSTPTGCINVSELFNI